MTTEGDAVFTQMKDDFYSNPSNPPTMGGKLYAWVKERSDSNGSYFDQGEFGAFLYHVTGDSVYAQRSYNKLLWYFAVVDCT